MKERKKIIYSFFLNMACLELPLDSIEKLVEGRNGLMNVRTRYDSSLRIE